MVRWFFALWLVMVCTPVHAQNAPRVLRDTETENFIKEQSTPIFRAAGLNENDVQIILVDDDTINSFVAGGQNVFIHSGLILAAENLDQLLGVIAHETGHIAGGHLVRLRDAAERASREMMLATVLGIAVGAASGESAAGAGVAMGGNQATQQLMLRFTRNQEVSADQAGLSYMRAARIPMQGLAVFLKHLLQNESSIEDRRAQYVRTHPLTKDRLSAVENFIAANKAPPSMTEKDEEEYRRIRSKLLGFIRPDEALRAARETPSTATHYGAAMAEYRLGTNRMAGIDALVQKEPDNAYFHELQGQMLFAAGRTDKAAQSLQRAVTLLPDAPLLQMLYGQVLLEQKKPAEAAKALERAVQKEPELSFAHRLLATAYGQQEGAEKMALSRLHLAEEALLKRNYKAAKFQAGVAQKEFPAGSPLFIRAGDILAIAGQKSVKQ